MARFCRGNATDIFLSKVMFHLYSVKSCAGVNLCWDLRDLDGHLFDRIQSLLSLSGTFCILHN